MRVLLLALLGVVVAGCRERPQPPPPQKAAVVAPPVPRAAEVTPTDRDVLEAVLLDMLADPKLEIVRLGARSEMVLHVRTPDSVGMLGYLQGGELRPETTEGVPRPLSEELFRRNRSGTSGSTAVNVSFAGLALDSRIVVAAVVPRDWEGFEARHPNAKGWVHAYLPSYDADGKSAFSTVRMGPAPHGALAKHQLVLENGRWVVRWRNYAFFA